MGARIPDPYSDESVTVLLNEFSGGDADAGARILARIYRELRSIAARHMRSERPNHTLQPTALINEAWIRLSEQPGVVWQNRAHFLAIASRQMHHILVDYARKRIAAKRGGPGQPTTLEEPLAVSPDNPDDLLLVHELLERLSRISARAARAAELHIFGGMSFDEIADALGTSTRTAKRDWSMACAWWRSELSKSQ